MIFRSVITKIFGAPLLSYGNILFVWYGRKAGLIIYQEPFPTLWPAVLILRYVFRIPLILLVHADPVAPRVVKKLYGVLRPLVFNGAVCVTTSPNLMAKVASDLYSRTEVIPLGIPGNLPVFVNRLELPSRFVLYAGRLSAYKGIPYLLESIAKLPEINFVIAGVGPLSKDIKLFLNSRLITNLWFIDRYITEEEKAELFSRCEFFVFPSINENEAFGIVQLEAMRLGKAVINTWIDSGVNFVAPHRVCSLTVTPRDHESLSRAIKQLWFEPELSKDLGRMGLERFSARFRLEQFQRSWTDLITGILTHE